MKIKTELIFPGKLKDQPILCEICKKFDISVSILEASFTTDTGWAIVTFTGLKAEIVRALSHLKKLGVQVKSSLNFM